jgi:hypothetical protein
MIDTIEDNTGLLEIIAEAMKEGVAPTSCPEGCVVELDGTCPHDFKSLILEWGLI